MAELVRRGTLRSVARHHELEVDFTSDHAIAVIIGPVPNPLEIWDVAKDARFAIKPSAYSAFALGGTVNNDKLEDMMTGEVLPEPLTVLSAGEARGLVDVSVGVSF